MAATHSRATTSFRRCISQSQHTVRGRSWWWTRKMHFEYAVTQVLGTGFGPHKKCPKSVFSIMIWFLDADNTVTWFALHCITIATLPVAFPSTVLLIPACVYSLERFCLLFPMRLFKLCLLYTRSGVDRSVSTRIPLAEDMREKFSVLLVEGDEELDLDCRETRSHGRKFTIRRSASIFLEPSNDKIAISIAKNACVWKRIKFCSEWVYASTHSVSVTMIPMSSKN